MLYLETKSTDPAYNLAYEEYVLTNRRDDDYLILWQNDPVVVVGQNQNPLEELDRAYAQAHGIRVMRRITGGGAVYHDSGNLNFTFISDAADAEMIEKELFVEPIVETLRSLGISAEASGRNDILADGKKISGTAQCLRGDRLLFHGTLLFDSDPERIDAVLQADPEKYKSKGIASVRSRVGNIRPLLREDMDVDAFREYLRRSFTADAPAEQLTAAEIASIKRLQKEKYESWEWTYGRSPQYDMTHCRRFAGGSLAVSMTVEQGVIQGISFTGDFLSRKDPSEVAARLGGLPCRREMVAAALQDVYLPDYFGTITAEELLQTILDE